MPLVAGVLRIALWMGIAVILVPVVGRGKWVNLIADKVSANTYQM